jgi:sulfoxide reductase heme-binding subunit YedZ
MGSTLRTLHHNPRFYILASSVLLSVLVACWLRISIPGDQLFGIRLQQTLGLLAIIYWYITLLISPLQKQLSAASFMPFVVFSRRAIGVSAAYFALLHVFISLFGQIGGFSGISLLPPRFFVAITLGFTALLILLVMAATSFDKVISFMTFPRWKFLHRFGYPAGILAMLHVWMIGTHMSYLTLQIIAFILLTTLFWLESSRLATFIVKKYPRLTDKNLLLSSILWLIMTFGLLLLPQAIDNSTSHHGQTEKVQ